MTHEDDLKKAVSLIKAGNKQAGAQTLRAILKQNRNHERAWLWMTACVETDNERRYCLDQVLRINPDNATARSALEKLNPQTSASAPPPTAAKSAEPTFSDGPLTPGSPATPSAKDDPFLPGRTKKQNTNRLILIAVLAFLGIGTLWALCAGAVYLYINNRINRLTENNSENTVYVVEYIVDGDAVPTGMIYTNAAGETEDWEVSEVPYSETFTMPAATSLMLIAENRSGVGSVRCEIKVNGVTVDAQINGEPGGQATCYGIAGNAP